MPRYIMLVIKDLAKFRLDRYQNNTDTAEKQPNDRFIQLHFSNKGIDMINFPQLLHSRPVLDTISGFIANKRPPLVSYSYSKTIGPKIFIFKRCIKDFNFDDDSISNGICNCKDSAYIDHDIGHVLTGNLNILRDRKLRKLLQKGPTYREQSNINWDINLKNYIKAVRQYKIKWAKQEKVDA